MARETGDSGGMTWLSGDYSRYATGRSLFDREDRNVFRPMPRNWRSPARTPNRQYDRYFPRTARR